MSGCARFARSARVSLVTGGLNCAQTRCLVAGARKRGSGGTSRSKGRPGPGNAGQAKQIRDNKRTLNDHYFLEAKRCNYLSRAAFKLKQIDEKFSVLKRRSCVLDLGCFPGAWLQVACQKLGSRQDGGVIVGIDLKQMDIPKYHCDERVHVLHGDARDLSRDALDEFTAGDGFHTVLSDMCHDTMGAPVADVASSLSLCEVAASIAVGNRYAISEAELQTLPASVQAEFQKWRQGVLRPGGALVMKILEARNPTTTPSTATAGSGTKEFADMLRPYFAKVAFSRPKATRKESREVYIVCIGHLKPSL